MNKFAIAQKREILEHAAAVGATASGITYVDDALKGLSRASGEGGLRSFGVEFASATTGCTIQAESVTVELKYLLRAHHDPRTRLVLEQPGRVSVRGKSPKGRNTSFLYTPDFLALLDNGLVGVECKSATELERLVRSRPGDYIFDKGRYRFLPGEACFERFGARFEVFCDAEVSKTHLGNLMLLCPLQEASIAPAMLEDIERVRSALEAKPRTLQQLRSQFGLFTDMIVLTGVANSRLHACVRSTSLTDAVRTAVFADSAAAATEDEKRLQIQLSERLLREQAWAKSAASLRASDIRAAYRRLAKIAEIAPGQPGASYYRNLATQVAERMRQGQERELAAATKYANCGNRGCRTTAQQPAMLACYEAHIATPNPKSKLEAHGLLEKDLELKGLDPVSYRTWCKFITGQGAQSTALAQSGARGFQALVPRTDEDDKRPVATTAGQIVHVDSSPEDCRVFAEIAGLISLERPCFALAVCEKSELILGMAVAFGNASRFLLALLIRDVIRRWGFYPPWIVNDGGPEHRANMWRNALAWNRTSILRRPIAGARASAPVENAIRSVNYGVPRKLSGSTRNDEACRRASNQTKSRATAVHDYELMQQLLYDFAHEHLAVMPKGFAHGSPRALFEADRTLRPIGWQASIDDPMTLIETAVKIDVRKRDFDPTDGIRVGLRNYCSRDLLDKAAEHRTFNEVRLDPEDPSLIYVQFDSGWVTAKSNDISELRELSKIELLVEGMHSKVRWDDNAQIRQDELFKVNDKLDKIEAAAKSRPSRPTPNPKPADPEPVVEDLFAKFAINPERFSTYEHV